MLPFAVPSLRERREKQMPRPSLLQLIGLALNVIGTAAIFMFAYPPEDERKRALFLLLTRLALVLMFCGFLLQLIAAWH
jgi:hypothetical protein